MEDEKRKTNKETATANELTKKDETYRTQRKEETFKKITADKSDNTIEINKSKNDKKEKRKN